MTYTTSIEALADPTRRKIYELIARRPQAVGELVTRVGISQPSVSQHLRVLRDAELVTVRREGTRRIYQARPDGLADLRDYLDQLWSAALAAFADHLEMEDNT